MRTAFTRIRLAVPLTLAVSFLSPNWVSAQSSVRAQTPAKPQASAPRPSTQTAEGEVIARIGATDLKAENLRAFIASLGARDQAALARDPALLSQLVRSLLANQLVLKEALAKHWDQKPDIAEQLQRSREIAIVDSYLRSLSQPAADFPDEAMVRNAYEANKTAFLVPRQFLLAQIYVALPRGAEKAAAEKAAGKLAEIQLKLKHPDANFDAISRTDSDEKLAADNGGTPAWVMESQLRPEIKEAVAGLAKNAISPPLKLDDGWHIIKLIDTKSAYTRPLEEVKEELIQRLRDEKAAANRRAYLAELLKQNPPAINEIALTNLMSETNQVSSK
ncbi:MAG TPA: peptidyl-prolyl cis-trans isomerase [Methylocella sp.]|nr:peptidyl-prolyl cis-trans isomerase [Methylocella sp.]